MATDTGRDDFVIAIRSAFLKRGTRQKFSLFTLLIISILVLSLEYFKSGPISTFRSITKDIIFKASFFISEPFVYIKNNYYNFKDHLQMYDEYTETDSNNLDKRILEIEEYKYSAAHMVNICRVSKTLEDFFVNFKKNLNDLFNC